MAKAAIQTTVRLDPELYERAKKQADRNHIPLNTAIVNALQDWVAKSEFEWQVVDDKAAREQEGGS